MDFVFTIKSEEKGKLKKVLEEEPYAGDSFARLGYDFKDSASLGLPGGKFVLRFKTDDDALAKKLVARAKSVEGVEEASADEKNKVLAALESEGDNAASGIGSIFG